MTPKDNRRQDYYMRIIESLNQRESWENRQRLFYQARYLECAARSSPGRPPPTCTSS